ncbi:MAG: hypothetical protein OEY90_07520 [Candidatus Bathyarchaeota archaeon]|nr:hypothetical protein [Candidatus Bathyarchaeota archaeon]
MPFKPETITLLPALLLFVLSSYTALLTFQIVDSSTQRTFLTLASSLFFGGLVLVASWGYYWMIHKRFRENKQK